MSRFSSGSALSEDALPENRGRGEDHAAAQERARASGVSGSSIMRCSVWSVRSRCGSTPDRRNGRAGRGSASHRRSSDRRTGSDGLTGSGGAIPCCGDIDAHPFLRYRSADGDSADDSPRISEHGPAEYLSADHGPADHGPAEHRSAEREAEHGPHQIASTQHYTVGAPDEAGHAEEPSAADETGQAQPRPGPSRCPRAASGCRPLGRVSTCP